MYEVPFSPPHQHLLLCAILTGVRWNFNVVSIFISFVFRDIEHFGFLVIHTSSFEKVLFSSLDYFFIGSLILGEFSFLSSLYILIINPLSYIYSWQRFSPIQWAASTINFILFHLSVLSLSCWAIWVLFRKSLPMPVGIGSRYSLLFPVHSSEFQVLY
jgi:hypothetical protein